MESAAFRTLRSRIALIFRLLTGRSPTFQESQTFRVWEMSIILCMLDALSNFRIENGNIFLRGKLHRAVFDICASKDNWESP